MKIAEPDTNKARTEEILAETCSSLAVISNQLSDLLDQTGAGNRNDVAVARLMNRSEEDVVLICNITLVSKNGVIASIESENTLPGALEPHMLSASSGNFCNMIDAVITNPLVSSFQAYVTDRAREHKSVSETMRDLGRLADDDLSSLHDD